MSLTTRMLAPIALIMSIALAFVAGSAYDNAKKIVSSNIVTIEATVVEAVSREIEFMLESTRNYMRLSAQRQIVKQYAVVFFRRMDIKRVIALIALSYNYSFIGYLQVRFKIGIVLIEPVLSKISCLLDRD